MLWTGLALAALIAGVEGTATIRKRNWKVLLVQGLFLSAGLVLAAMVQFHLWLSVDLLWPTKAVFTPVTEWIYRML